LENHPAITPEAGVPRVRVSGMWAPRMWVSGMWVSRVLVWVSRFGVSSVGVSCRHRLLHFYPVRLIRLGDPVRLSRLCSVRLLRSDLACSIRPAAVHLVHPASVRLVRLAPAHFVLLSPVQLFLPAPLHPVFLGPVRLVHLNPASGVVVSACDGVGKGTPR